MPNALPWRVHALDSRRSTCLRPRRSRRFVADFQVLESREVLSPPTVPGTPVLTGLGATSATIAWGASTDTVPITAYSVYWIYTTGHSGRGGGITTHYVLEGTTNGSTTTITINGLTQNATYPLYVRATDSAGFVSGYSAPVRVTPGALPSAFTATLGGSAVANHTLTVQLKATSFSAPTYSILNPPAGMTVNPSSGLVTWTPGAANVGTTNVTFQATNQFGTTPLTVPITVTADVPVPGFTFNNYNSPTFSVIGLPIGLQITDASNTPSTYSVVSAPANVSINPTTGQVIWTPTPDQAGAQALTFQLTNSAGTAQITVNPVIYIADAPQNVNATGLDTLSPTLNWSPPVYNSLVAGYRVMISGPDYYNDTFTTSGSTLSAPMNLTVYPGTYQVNIQALDANGNQGLWNTSLSFYYAPSVPNPTYAFTSNSGAAFAVVGQPTTIQVTDQNTSSPDTYAILSGPDGMSIDPNTGLLTWTATLADLGASYPVVAVTNSVGTSYLTLTIPVVFTGPVNNVTAALGASGTEIDVAWTAPPNPSEPIAGYDIYLTWIDGDGYQHNAAGVFAPAGSTSYALTSVPGDAAAMYVTVVAVDASGNEGAYPLSGTQVKGVRG
jgi:hypothetical protein